MPFGNARNVVMKLRECCAYIEIAVRCSISRGISTVGSQRRVLTVFLPIHRAPIGSTWHVIAITRPFDIHNLLSPLFVTLLLK